MSRKYYYELELLFGVRDDLYDIITSADQTGLPARIKRLLDRAQGTDFLEQDPETTRNWTLGRCHVNIEQYCTPAPYNGDRKLLEFDRENPLLQWLHTTFALQWQWFRPVGAWWFDDGMQVGTRYADKVGNVAINDPAWHPWFPFDNTRLKRWMPDYVDRDGAVLNVVHDCAPQLVYSGQFEYSLGNPPLRRRVRQISTNEHLGASAFGTEPWQPPTREAEVSG